MDDYVDEFLTASQLFRDVIVKLLGKKLEDGHEEAVKKFHDFAVKKLWKRARGGSA